MCSITINQMTMKNSNQYLYKLGLLTLIYGLFTMPSYAEQTEVEQLEENLKIAETVKIYGKGTLQGGYSMENYPDKYLFSPAFILANQKSNPKPKLVFDLAATLGLKKTVFLNEKDVLLNMEIGLNKEGKAKIKKLCGTHSNWVIGLATSSFANLDVLPSLLGTLPNSAVASEAIQIQWKQQIDPNYSYAIGFEEASKFDLDPAEKDEDKKKKKNEQPNNGFPFALTGNIRFNYPGTLGHVQLGSLGRALSYYHKTDKKSYSTMGFGVNLGTQFNVTPEKTILKTSAVYGQGIGGYIFDLAVLEKEVNTAYINPASKELKTVNAWGLYGALEYRWVPEVRFTLSGGSLATINSQDRDVNAYKMGYYAAANVSYHPTDQFNFGIEYLYGNRTNLNNKDSFSNRIQTIAVYKF